MLQPKYKATIQLHNGTCSHTFSSDFDFCFQFLQQQIRWGDYAKAFIVNTELDQVVMIMREINAHRV